MVNFRSPNQHPNPKVVGEVYHHQGGKNIDRRANLETHREVDTPFEGARISESHERSLADSKEEKARALQGTLGYSI